MWQRVINDASSSKVPLDKARLELARLQVSEDFKTPPIIAEWIPISNIVYPTIQKIMLGDLTSQEGLDQAAKDAHGVLEQAGYYK